MKTSTIGRIKKILKIPLIILFYLGVWQLLSIIVDSSLLLPSPVNTLQRLFELIQKSETWKDIGNTFLRLLLGYGAGAFIGIVLAVITANCHFLYELLSPLRLLIQSTPVLSFVLILLVSMVSNMVPVAVAAIMVAPMLWATTEQCIFSLDPKLSEMSAVYLTPWKTLRYVILPQMIPQIIVSSVTALGFAWKSVITAEVLALPRFAIGNRMHLSKIYLETTDMFAWTILIIILSLSMEIGLKKLVQKRKGGLTDDSNS